MPIPVAMPLESVQPSGVTTSYSYDNFLVVAKSSLVEIYEYRGLGLVLICSARFSHPILQFYRLNKQILAITAKEVLQLDEFSLQVLKKYQIQAPGEEQFQSQTKPLTAFIQSQKILVIAAGNSYNYINVIYLDKQEDKHDIHQFRSGQLVSIASYGEYLSILARSLPADPNVVLNAFANQRTSSLQIFSAAGGRLREVQKTLQLPFDAYCVKSAPLGFIIIAPRQFIFKRIAGVSDLRFRFANLHEEIDPDIEYIQQVFEKNFEQPMDFDFSNLVKGKVINHLTFNMQLENDQIHTIQQKRLPLAPRQLVPGHPVLDLQEYFKFYGYNQEEISMKLNQVQNIIGDFPVIDFLLEAELRRYKDNNLHYIGIQSNVQNFIEIAPLYDVEIQFLDDNLAILVDNNGLMYSLHVFEEDVHMYPIIIADKDLSIRTDNRVHTISLMKSSDVSLNLFTLEESSQRKEFEIFLGSFTQDSYICRLQITKDIPSIDFYNDHRQRETTNPNDYRNLLLDELKKNCSIINRKNEGQTKEAMNTEIVEIGPSFFKKQVDENILKKLYPARYDLPPCNQFEGANLFQVAQEQKQQTLDNVDHCVLRYEFILPSLAGVVDSVMKPINRKSTIGSLVMLNNSGVIQTLQSKLDLKNVSFIPSIEPKIRRMHLVNYISYKEEEESIIIMSKRNGNFVYKIIKIDDQYSFEEIQQFKIKEVILNSIIIDEKQTLLITHQSLVNMDFVKTSLQTQQLSQNILIHGSFNKNGFACCSQQELILHNFKTLQYERISILSFLDLLSIETSEVQSDGDRFMSASTKIIDQSTLQCIFNINYEFLFTAFVTLSSSSVIIIGINEDLSIHIIYQFSQLKQNLPLPNFSNIQKQIAAHGFNTVVYPYFTKNQSGMNMYLVSATRGGCIYVYFYNRYSQKFSRIYGEDSPIIQPTLSQQNFVDYDYWGNNYVIEQKEIIIRDILPFQTVMQEDVEVAICTFPTPYKLSEACSIVIVPTLTASVSFYQLGAPLSGLKFNGISLTCNLPYPPRCCFQFGKKIVGIFDTNSIQNQQDTKIASACSLGVFDLDFGEYTSSLLDLKYQRAMHTNFLLYASGLSQQGSNCKRNLIAMPFQGDKLVYHSKSDTFIIVGSSNRREIRTPRSMTLDEVANIRIFETVDEQERYNAPQNEIIENCHSLIQRDPPPVNSYQLIHHQYMFLFSNNKLVDGTQLELQRLEHVNHVASDLLFSNYPQRFGRYWQGHNIYMDKYGRMDRRNKNDDSDKRLEVLENYKLKQELREMIILCSNYTLGSFQKCYGKIQILAVDIVSQETLQKDEEIKQISIQQIENDYQSRALRRNINTNFFVCNQSRIPCGMSCFQLNKIAFEELQNAVSAAVCAPSAKCVMVGESKHIKCYNLVDSQKLQLCAQWLGMGHVTHISRFQDFFLISDATLESRLWAFKDRGKRISEMSELSKNFAARLGNFFVNQYSDVMHTSFIIENALVLHTYKFNAEKRERRERLQSQQLIHIPETAVSILKIPTFVPLPADSKMHSGLANVVVTVEGSVLQVIPVPSDICVMAGVKERFIRPKMLLNPFDREGHFVSEVSFEWEQKLFQYEIQMIKAKVKSTAGAW
ncbi:hypothetical protein SS50377_24344 [Spironucleus salmonicida]|uniref:Cleavage/polyadenylation specificity factor A subunit C-terminal domain-containing protein n=1 Tax=Spironucleus salmonicida TaxID=348837 RepID=V6LZ44_9EUKA|nr:hypothetical protein SS50377_24344 [Spironucleus salmonicida]|eukprot:EST46104.1 hypothetical protein SS50377_14098 [Spironucleus salmonicida]